MVHYLSVNSLVQYSGQQKQRAQKVFDALRFGLKQEIEYEFFVTYPGTDEGSQYRRYYPSVFMDKIEALDQHLVKQPFHVYFRPFCSSYILVDDISLSSARRMFKEGFEPSAVIETSRDNFQAWVCVANVDIRGSHATNIARVLAKRFGGDPASAAHRHLGRFPGFPNVKPKHRHADGAYPITRLHYAKHAVITRSDELLRETKDAIEGSRSLTDTGINKIDYRDEDVLQTLWEQLEDRLWLSRKKNASESAITVARQIYVDLIAWKKRQGIDVSQYRSEIDLAVVCRLVHRGFGVSAIAEAIEVCSTDIERRHPKLGDYIGRTVRKGLINVIEEKGRVEVSAL